MKTANILIDDIKMWADFGTQQRLFRVLEKLNIVSAKYSTIQYIYENRYGKYK